MSKLIKIRQTVVVDVVSHITYAVPCAAKCLSGKSPSSFCLIYYMLMFMVMA